MVRREVATRGGFALLATIFILLVLGAAGYVLTGLQSSALKAAVRSWHAVRAMEVADAGLRWVFQNEFANDLDFSNNLSPTNAPFGNIGVSVSPEDRFWVEYTHPAPPADKTGIDLTVTSRMGNAERKVKAHLEVRSARPLRRAIYAVGPVNLTQASGAITAASPYAAIESQSFIALPGAGLAISGTTKANSSYRRFLGINVSVGSYLYNTANVVLTGNQTWVSGTYGAPGTGFIWYIDAGDLILSGGATDTITIHGTVVLGSGQVRIQGSPTVVWTAYSKGDLDLDGVNEVLPAFVADSADFGGASNITVNGIACARTSPFVISNGCNFTLNGVLLAGNGVSTGVNPVTLNITYSAATDNSPYPGALDAPWLEIQGPDVEYFMTQWKEDL